MAQIKVPFYGHVKQYEGIKADIDKAISDVLYSGNYVQGPALKKFEEELAAYTGADYAVGVGNGTDALWLAMMALNIGPGDEVITNANTFFATVEAIWTAGATAVLVDADKDTRTIDIEAIKAAITDKTKAIAPVHLYGQTANMPEIRKIADENNLFIIEDNAQAFGAAGDNFKIGQYGDVVCTSFIIQKNLGCYGDGGALWTNRKEVNDTVRKLRNHGSDARDHHSYGFNSRLDDLQAAVLSIKLKHIDAWNDNRIALAKVYDEGLKDVDFITLPYARPGYRHIYHLYEIETKDPAERDKLLKYLNDNGIDAKTHYSIAVHKQEGFPWGKPVRISGSLENAEKNASSCISLPIFPELSVDDAKYVIEVLKGYKK
ncbi:MAG: DegT/DnrJ/EryC1/StrS family aminotransferase [Oscillospiraceae bacterium]|jgi:dTDP-4-amino-4,6-dideoxygalactose transaminase|nr:DegT/DnrJ/EryC1/StrS family aminotransferase [Oscillospiraceae bacterium]